MESGQKSELISYLKDIFSGFIDCTFAFNGKEALRNVREKSFDLIISDLRMPEMDGAQFKKELNKIKFKTISSTFFNPELLLRRGNYTKMKPDFLSKKDMLKGKSIITDLSRRGIGQGVVIRNSHVVTIEDSDGTDAMLKRASILFKRFSYRNKRQGILLKFPKRNQDLRVDLPTVGIKTIKKCMKIGLKGIVVKANQNIFLDRSKCINLANKNRMFICAI